MASYRCSPFNSAKFNRICVAESENSPGYPRLVETYQTKLKTMIPARGAPTKGSYKLLN